MALSSGRQTLEDALELRQLAERRLPDGHGQSTRRRNLLLLAAMKEACRKAIDESARHCPSEVAMVGVARAANMLVRRNPRLFRSHCSHGSDADLDL